MEGVSRSETGSISGSETGCVWGPETTGAISDSETARKKDWLIRCSTISVEILGLEGNRVNWSRGSELG